MSIGRYLPQVRGRTVARRAPRAGEETRCRHSRLFLQSLRAFGLKARSTCKQHVRARRLITRFQTRARTGTQAHLLTAPTWNPMSRVCRRAALSPSCTCRLSSIVRRNTLPAAASLSSSAADAHLLPPRQRADTANWATCECAWVRCDSADHCVSTPFRPHHAGKLGPPQAASERSAELTRVVPHATQLVEYREGPRLRVRVAKAPRSGKKAPPVASDRGLAQYFARDLVLASAC